MGKATFRVLLLTFIGCIAILLPTAPITTTPTFFSSPDFLICLIFSWSVNDPKSARLFIILFLTLFADMVWERPLGLWPIFTLIAAEILKTNYSKIKQCGLILKTIFFIFFLSAINAGVKLIAVIGIIKPENFWIWISHFTVTIVAFPFMNLFLELTILKKTRVQ